jgi:RNA polymerase sigma-70 factor (ECF subfamily)
MDRPALLALLENQHKESYGWALSCCSRNPAEAEIVLQKVYVKILDGKARFDERSTFKTWLFAIIRRTAADRRRRRLLHSFRLVRYDEASSHDAQEESLNEAIYQSEIQAVFKDALDRLPKRQREVLQLVFYHDLSLAEAAKAIGVSLGSVSVHYERGKKQLRKWMERSKVFDETELERREIQTAIPPVKTGG